MKTTTFGLLVLASGACLFFGGILSGGPRTDRNVIRTQAPRAGAPARPFGIPKRVPWTTSHIVGSPEPPHPYVIERAFPKLVFKNPLLITNAPGSDRLFVGEHAGKLFSFKNELGVAKADLFLDLRKELHGWDTKTIKGVHGVYALAFHPSFAKNRYCYMCYIIERKDGGPLDDGTRVSRFTVTDTDPPRCDPKSEKIIITWFAGGHNGCDLKFGPDGFLYISTGDGSNPNPPDARDTGQDISDLLSSILRIDVDKADPEGASPRRNYAIPPDNPFIKTPKARPEVWAYGFRNPWRMSFDSATGDLWVGDVGWELWEMIYRVKRGGNYGWSIMEGPQVVHPKGKRGPTPILPPTIEFPHTEAASITGGFVYHGKRLKDLAGAYICGDWVTRRLWGTRFNGDKIVSHKELAQGTQRIVGFAEDNSGELFFLDYDEAGKIYQLAPNPEAKKPQTAFPRKLSETGLFASVNDQTPAPGVIPFSINTEMWADHTTAERFVALPGTTTVQMYDQAIPIPLGFYSGRVFAPKNAVLARTVYLDLESGNPKSRRKLETQVLHNDGVAWRGYTYAWNDEQTDAMLVPSAGLDRTFAVRDKNAPDGRRRQKWHFPSRAECITCHNPWAGYALAFTLPQLTKDHRYGEVVDNQVRALRHAGLIDLYHRDEKTEKITRLSDIPPEKLTNPFDESAPLADRARSYLHVNCSHCHQFGAGGTADIELRQEIPIDETKTLEVRPVQGSFDIDGAHIVSPGDPYRSTLYYRMAKLGRGRMPHIGSEIVDESGLRLIHDWIRRLPIRKSDRAAVAQLQDLRNLDETAVLARERADTPRRLRALAQQIASSHGREQPSAADRKEAEAKDKAEAAQRAQARAAERAETIRKLLSTTSSALLLARAMGEGRIPKSIARQVLDAARALPSPQVRDLFERFLPDDQRIKRLGTTIKPEQILALKGDVNRGRELFFRSASLQCVQCHKIAGAGGTLGPDLSEIAKKNTRAKILEKVLDPSKLIEPKYVPYLIETDDGKSYTGVIASKTDKEIVLKMIGDKELKIPPRMVSKMLAQKKSLMPEQLLRDVTAEEAADLMAFLATLR